MHCEQYEVYPKCIVNNKRFTLNAFVNNMWFTLNTFMNNRKFCGDFMAKCKFGYLASELIHLLYLLPPPPIYLVMTQSILLCMFVYAVLRVHEH